MTEWIPLRLPPRLNSKTLPASQKPSLPTPNPCPLPSSVSKPSTIQTFRVIDSLFLFFILPPKYTSLRKYNFSYFLSKWSHQFSSVAQSCPTPCDPIDCSMPGLPVHHQLLEFTQTHVYWVSDAIQPSHPLSSPSPPAFNLSQHQGLFQWVSSSHQVAKVLVFQLQHQSFQWIFRIDFL